MHEQNIKYLKYLVNKWGDYNVSEEVIEELHQFGKVLSDITTNTALYKMKVGLLDEEKGVKEAGFQYQQLLLTSFFWGLEFGQIYLMEAEKPTFHENLIGTMVHPMNGFLVKTFDEMRKRGNIRADEFDEYIEFAAKITVDTANNCFHKGVTFYIVKNGPKAKNMTLDDLQLSNHITRINPIISEYNHLMGIVRDRMGHPPGLFGRKRWEGEVMISLDKLLEVAKKLPGVDKQGDPDSVWFCLDAISRETELMVRNFKEHNIIEANLRKDKVSYYFDKLSKALGDFETRLNALNG